MQLEGSGFLRLQSWSPAALRAAVLKQPVVLGFYMGDSLFDAYAGEVWRAVECPGYPVDATPNYEEVLLDHGGQEQLGIEWGDQGFGLIEMVDREGSYGTCGMYGVVLAPTNASYMSPDAVARKSRASRTFLTPLYNNLPLDRCVEFTSNPWTETKACGYPAEPGLVTFTSPRHAGLPVHRCTSWNRGCDAPAATAYCRLQGLSDAVDIGDYVVSPIKRTSFVGANYTCSGPICFSPRWITCGTRGTPLPVMFDAAWYGKTTTTVPKAGFTDDLWKLHLAARGASEVVVMSTKMDGLKLVVRTRVDFPAGGDPDAKALFDELAGNSRPAWLTGALNGGAVVAALSRGELRQPAAPPPPPTPPAVTFKDPQIYDNPLDWCSSWGPTFDGGKCGLFVANRWCVLQGYAAAATFEGPVAAPGTTCMQQHNTLDGDSTECPSGCKTFSFITCTGAAPAPLPPAPPMLADWSATCNATFRVFAARLLGYDVLTAPAASDDTCCSACSQAAGCTGWTWKPDGGGSCTLKNAASSAYYTATRSAPDGTIFRALGRRQLARGVKNVVSIVYDLCVGRTSCTVQANNDLLGGPESGRLNFIS
ncbi:Cathepsin L [Micractinium conductrix]|uniref:Cathepsin L n=1 Tax=Micractinium conductrix TaxID=554055 RepID=A0A2P6VHF7_9CHLO|nr:Cathepsin L [Micractinium conductrix]|eukprot:PSC73515.1 Cathepsin L [Micractinium conductrix]